MRRRRMGSNTRGLTRRTADLGPCGLILSYALCGSLRPLTEFNYISAHYAVVQRFDRGLLSVLGG